MVDGGGVKSAYTHCQIYAAAKRNSAGRSGFISLTSGRVRGNGAGGAHSHRRKLTWLRGTALEALVPAAGTTS